MVLATTIVAVYSWAMASPPTTSRRPRNLREELGKKHPFESAAEEAHLNILRTADQLSTAYREVFQQHGLSSPVYNALRIIAARGEAGVPSQSIAKDMVTRDPDVTRLVDRLVKADLVTRHRSEQDRRVVYVRVTDSGRAKLAALHPLLKEMGERVFGHVSDTQLSQLSSLLFTVRNAPEPAAAT